jgi:hypothetical protein
MPLSPSFLLCPLSRGNMRGNMRGCAGLRGLADVSGSEALHVSQDRQHAADIGGAGWAASAAAAPSAHPVETLNPKQTARTR